MDLIYFFEFAENWSYKYGYIYGFPYDMLIVLLIGFIGFAIVYAFQAISLYTIGKRNGFGHLWMAFVPFANTYYLGVVSDKNKIFNAKPKYFSLALAILEFLLVVGYVLYYISFFVLRGTGYITYEWTELIAGSEYGYYQPYLSTGTLPYTYSWMGWIVTYMGNILYYVRMGFLLLQVFVYISFFQTYAHNRYFIMALFAVLAPTILFPIAGIIMFFVRKNKPMNYRDYMRMIQERRYRQYQQNQQYGNPYNYNPYSGNPNNPNQNNGGYNYNNGGAAADPFDDFSKGAGNTNNGNNGNNNNTNNGGDTDPFEDF